MRRPALLSTDPVPTLLDRVRQELRADFDPAKPLRVSRAPGRLDVMGGIADYTGSMVCEMPLEEPAAVAVQGREERALGEYSFNRFDRGKAFAFQIPLESLAGGDVEALRREFAREPGNRWAAYVAGCLVALNVSHRVIGRMRQGLNIAVYSTVPAGAGVSSSAAMEV